MGKLVKQRFNQETTRRRRFISRSLSVNFSKKKKKEKIIKKERAGKRGGGEKTSKDTKASFLRKFASKLAWFEGKREKEERKKNRDVLELTAF